MTTDTTETIRRPFYVPPKGGKECYIGGVPYTIDDVPHTTDDVPHTTDDVPSAPGYTTYGWGNNCFSLVANTDTDDRTRKPTIRIKVEPSGITVNIRSEEDDDDARYCDPSLLPQPMVRVSKGVVRSGEKPTKKRTSENIRLSSLAPIDYAPLPTNFPFSATKTSLSQWKTAFLNVASGVTVVEGSIGAGKTTFGKGAANLMHLLGIPTEFLEEPMIEDYLNLFLKDQKRHAYGFQREKCFARSKVYRKAEKLVDRRTVKAVLIDRSRQGDWAFALMHRESGNISEEEYATYLNILKRDSDRLRKPDRCLYFEVTPKTAMRRIDARDRCGEDAYDEKYLQDLRWAYDRVLNPKLCDFPIRKIPYDKDEPMMAILASDAFIWDATLFEKNGDDNCDEGVDGKKIKDWLSALPSEMKFSSFREFLDEACTTVLTIFEHEREC